MLIRPRAQFRDISSSGLSDSVAVEDLAALKALTSRPFIVLVRSGQAKGQWAWWAGSATTADDALTVECTSGEAGRYKRVYDGRLTPQMCGAVGDGVANDTAAFVLFFSLGGGDIPKPAAFYSIDSITVDNVFEVWAHPDARIKWRTLPALDVLSTKSVLKFTSGASGFKWHCGGIIDGNRAAFGPSFVGSMGGGLAGAAGSFWWAGVEIAADCDDWYIGPFALTIEEVYGHSMSIHHCSGWRMDWHISRSTGAGVRLDNCESLTKSWSIGTLYNQTDNRYDGVNPGRFNAHVIDIWESRNGTIDTIIMDGCYGLRNASFSQFLSGFTQVTTDNVRIQRVVSHRLVGGAGTTLLPVSYVHPNAGYTGRVEITGQHDLGFEWASGQNSRVDLVVIDGEYRTSINTRRIGVTLKDGGLERSTEASRAGKPQNPGTGNSIGRIVARRTVVGVSIRGGGVAVGEVVSEGCDEHGIVIDHAGENVSGFPGADQMRPDDIVINSADIINSSLAGIRHNNGHNLTIDRLRVIDNGAKSGVQDQQSGYMYPTLGFSYIEPIDGVHFGDVYADTSYGTITGAISFAPQAAVGAAMDSSGLDTMIAYAIKPEYFTIGKYLTLVGVADNAGSPKDIEGRVVEIDKDKLIIAVETTDAWVATHSIATTLTGTFSSSGTTLTGVGSALTTEVLGATYVYHAASGEARRILVTSSATAAVLESAFTTPLSGATLTLVQADVSFAGVQRNGVVANSANITGVTIRSIRGQGSIAGRVTRIDPASLEVGETMIMEGEAALAAATQVITSIPAGWDIIDWSFAITTNVTGPTTSFNLVINDGVDVQTLATLLGLTTAHKASGGVSPRVFTDATTHIRIVSVGGTPTGGRAKVSVKVKKGGLPALRNS